MATTTLRTETAHHEAGHAVVRWALEQKFKYVTIKPEEGALGHVLKFRSRLTEVSSKNAILLHVICESVIGYAGQIAQQKHKGKVATFRRRNSNPQWCADNDEADNLAINWLGYSFETLDAFQQYTFASAEGIVARQWKSIQAVAAALLERETLTYNETIDVIMPGTTALRERLQSRRANAQKRS
jgi:hypothetical protein